MDKCILIEEQNPRWKYNVGYVYHCDRCGKDIDTDEEDIFELLDQNLSYKYLCHDCDIVVFGVDVNDIPVE